jgi:protein-S-isoprenylcysteine O-methyltransferase Ste14
MARSSVELPGWLRWAGVTFGAAAAVLVTWTLHTLGHNLTDTVVTRKNASLVTFGPYRWVRHPFYVSFALAVVGNTLVTANGFLGLIGVAALAAVVVRTRIEERFLIDRFGRDYVHYIERTGRFFPRLFTRRAPR